MQDLSCRRSRWRPRQCLFAPSIHWRGCLLFKTATICVALPAGTSVRVSGSPTSIDEPAPGPRAYRVFSLSAGGRVAESKAIEAQSDDEAKAIAATLPNGHGIDLWERSRYLASYPPQSAAYPKR